MPPAATAAAATMAAAGVGQSSAVTISHCSAVLIPAAATAAASSTDRATINKAAAAAGSRVNHLSSPIPRPPLPFPHPLTPCSSTCCPSLHATQQCAHHNQPTTPLNRLVLSPLPSPPPPPCPPKNTGLACSSGRTASWLTSAWPSLTPHQETSRCSTQTGERHTRRQKGGGVGWCGGTVRGGC